MIKSWFTLRFLALNLLFVALPLLVDTTLFMKMFYETTVDKARQELKEIADLRALAMSELQPKKEFLLDTLIYFMDLEKGPYAIEKWDRQLEEMQRENPGHLFAILDPKTVGDHRYLILAASWPRAVGKPFESFYEADQVFEKGKGVFIRYFYRTGDPPQSARLYLLSMRLFDREGAPGGILVEGSDVTHFVEEILSTEYFTSLNFALLNDQNIALAATDPSFAGTYFTPLSPQKREEVMQSRNLGAVTLDPEVTKVRQTGHLSFYEFELNGQTQIAYNSYVPYMHLSVMVYTPKSYFFAKALRQYITLYAVYVAILIIGVVVTVWIGVWISRPLHQLCDLMDEVSREVYDHYFIPQPLGFEINILGGVFNNTLSSLQRNIQQAEDEHVKRQMYQRELAIGQEVQQSLFPTRFPAVEGLEVAGFYLPSERVSGDFFLIEPMKKGALIALCDIGGSGISSSLYALSVRSLLRTYAALQLSAEESVAHLNDAFDAEEKMRSTAFIATYDPSTRRLHTLSCGHIPALVKRKNGEIEIVESCYPPLGEGDGVSYEPHSVQLKESDFLLLLTDGLTELRGQEGGRLGIEGVVAFLSQRPFTSAQEGVELIEELYVAHAKEEKPDDEILVVVAKVV